MSFYIENKYVSLIATKLGFRNFKKVGPSHYVFSCIFCGDSLKNKHKARGNIYQRNDNLYYHCYNCSKSISFSNFLKELDEVLYTEYKLEKYYELNRPIKNVDEIDMFREKKNVISFLKNPLKGLKNINKLSYNDPIKLFVDNRKIPSKFYYKLYSCPNFFHFVNTLIPYKFSEESLVYDETRLLIPFYDENGSVFGFQGRSLDKNTRAKYITIILNENYPLRVFGLDRVNFDKELIVVEGPLDSLFLSNSIAVCGSDFMSYIKQFDKNKTIICYDNEPRNFAIIKNMNKAILNGFKVCIFPDNFEFKDINDAIIGGFSSDYIEYIIKSNIYSGLEASLKLKQWTKVKI